MKGLNTKIKLDFIECGLDEEDLDEWFQTEVVQGETVYVCNLCDKGFEDINKLKKHLICKHKDAIVVLSSNAVRKDLNN